MELFGRLAESRIFESKFWSVPDPSLPAKAFPRAAALRESFLTMPVHQESGARDIERIVDAVLSAS